MLIVPVQNSYTLPSYSVKQEPLSQIAMATAVQEVVATLQDVQSIPLPVSSRDELLAFIRGSRVTIPDLQSMISHWPQTIHPEIGKLEKYVQDSLDS